ncbi:hypothetical protein TCAL_10102 [Tigriopus californicus]|uniref:Uncharacterized protein n=1 Tax=Tigriopus californicus TaxID=6832 RepID=A0A553NYK1_TIGCA|nr:hypothetical protein TCAL_10102 [Tigriopus californicus]|eukprot:TCALIF_10102-PA protein Name:"Protein of unknown function" AED:0.65 eAED:0.65 QI:0/0/0/0.5/0/0.5/2/0/62
MGLSEWLAMQDRPATLALSENMESQASRDAATTNGRPTSVSSLLDESDDEVGDCLRRVHDMK